MARGKYHKRLGDISPAYVTYCGLDALPPNAPAFEVDGDGQPKVHVAEHFCRLPVPLKQGRLCGRRYSDRDQLKTHMVQHHQKVPKSVDIRTAAMLKTADEFYRSLMKGHAGTDDEDREDNTWAAPAIPILESNIEEDDGEETERDIAPSATPSIKQESGSLEIPDEEVENDVKPVATILRKRKSRVVDLTDDDLEGDLEQIIFSPPRKRSSRPQKPQSNASGDLEQIIFSPPGKRPSRPQKPQSNASGQAEALEHELKKIKIQKQMHAAELRELELEQALLLLRKGSAEASTS